MSARPIAVTIALLLGACSEGPEPSPACVQYTACIRAQDQLAGVETNLDRFDPGGACWEREGQAEVCTQACERGLDWERERNVDAPMECGP